MNSAVLEMFLRWMHYFAGVIWIGILYYFNFVQGEWFKEADGGTKNNAISKLVPRALFWFRYGALFTFLSGVAILGYKGHMLGGFNNSWGIAIGVGATLGTLMFLNVWLIIWPNQKIVIQNAQNVLEGKPAIPEAAACGAKAGLASRHNVLFSLPMLFFMGAASHLPLSISETFNPGLLVGVLALVIGGLQFNAMKGKLGPLTTVKGVIHMGVFLCIALYAIVEALT